MRRKLLSGVFSILLISGLAILVQFFAIKILTDRSVHDVAMWAIFEGLTAFLMAVGVWGGESTVINRCSAGQDVRSGAKAHSIILVFAALILGFPVVLIISHYVKISLAPIFGIYIAAFFVSLCFIISLYLRAIHEFALSSIVERLNIFGFFILILSTTYLGHSYGVDVLIVCSSVLALVLAGCVFFTKVNSISLRGDFSKSIHEVLYQDKAAHYSLTNFIIFLYERLDQFLILALMGSRSVAAYFICYKLSFFIRFFSKAVNQVAFTLISRAVNNKDILQPAGAHEVHALQSLNFNINIAVAFVFSVMLVVVSEFLLKYFNVFSYENICVLSILSFSLFLSVPNQVSFNLINARGRGDLFFENALRTTILQVGVMLVAGYFFGVVGVALSRLVAVIYGNLNASKYLRALRIDAQVPSFFYLLLAILVASFVWRIFN